MKLLIVNANTSGFVTERVAAGARAALRPGDTLEAVTGRFGARVIGTRTELAVAEHATIDLLAQHAGAFDAAVIAVSYDCALFAAREMLDIPVVGITEAALLSACMLGGRIGMVVFGARVLPIYRELVQRYGLDARVGAWRAIESDAPYAAGDQSEADALTVAAARELIEREHCEVVVLTGAVMADVPARLQHALPVPLLDGVSCAVRMAQLLVDTRAVKPRTGSFAALPVREVTGVSDALRKRFDGGPP